MWCICALHINELPLRHLFVQLDGPTTGDQAFKGPVGKRLKHAESYKIDKQFVPITDGDGIRKLPPAVVKLVPSFLLTNYSFLGLFFLLIVLRFYARPALNGYLIFGENSAFFHVFIHTSFTQS